MSNQNNILISGLLVFFLIVFGNYFWSAIGLGLTLFYFLRVIDGMGQRIPIVDLMTALACLQWIVGPFIDYHNDAHHVKYHMYVAEEVYMSFAVPAIIAFRLGTSLFKDHSDLDVLSHRVNQLFELHPKLPYVLIAVGLIIPFFSPLLPGALGFILYLLSNIKYIGVIYLLFSSKPNRWPIFWATMSLTAVVSIGAGMFHDLLLWSMLTFTFVAREMKLSLVKKLGVALLGIFLAITIQSVKMEYRSLVWQRGYSGNKVVLFLSLAAQQWSTGSIFTPNSDEDMNIRLNQGWIISAIMHHVPANKAHANGQTILEGLESSLIPRFLAPNKKVAGGRENFRNYTGLKIGEHTSMGISILGEGYANYGVTGGFLFMFFWGMFIGWFWKKLWDISDIYPTLLIWSPILFLQVVKAETEFAVVLNHLIKSTILVFGVLWFIKRQFNIRL